jgi:hypothetical protein
MPGKMRNYKITASFRKGKIVLEADFSCEPEQLSNLLASAQLRGIHGWAVKVTDKVDNGNGGDIEEETT